MRPHYFPIAYKLALAFTLLTAGGMGLLGLVIARNQTRLLEQQMTEFGNTVAKQMAESAKEPLLANDTLALKVVANNLISHDRILGAAIYSDEGRLIVSAGATPANGVVAAAKGNGAPMIWHRPEFQPAALVSFLGPVRFKDVNAGYTLITFDRSLMEHAKRETIRAVSGATVILVSLGVMASFVLGKRLTRPIDQLMHASRAISAGDYEFRIDDKRNDELGLLMGSLNAMSVGLLRKEQVEQAFSRYVSPSVAKEVLADLTRVQLGGRHIQASVLFADIVGFTSMSENMRPDEVNALLNEYFGYIAEAAGLYHGYVDKYIGDCAMLVFGIPDAEEDHSVHAVTCGVFIQRLVAALNTRRAQREQPPVRFRIGVNSGGMLAGNMGSAERMDYTVVGDAVNLASRLSGAGAPDQTIIGELLYKQVLGAVTAEQQGTMRLRGKEDPVACYHVSGVKGQHREFLESHLARMLERQPEVTCISFG